MAEPIERGGESPAPDRMPDAGQSIVACRALAAPVTVNRAARTVEVVWSTGARARNFVPPYGPILEELDMAPSAVRIDALRSGRAPVLDTHRRAGTATGNFHVGLATVAALAADTTVRACCCVFRRPAHEHPSQGHAGLP